MTRLPVIIRPTVQDQMDEQPLYIARHSVGNAISWQQRLEAEVARLGDFHGHAVDEPASDRVGETVRKCVFERTYLIHHRITDDGTAVEVVNFRHGARRPRRDEP